MTNDTRTSDDIERAIVDERAQMSDTLNNLQEKFSVNAILNDVGAMVRGQGADIGRAISDTVGRNPAAVVLVGVGLAWLFLGQNRRSGQRSGSDPWNAKTLASNGLSDGPFADEDQFWYGYDRSARDGGSFDRVADRRGAAGVSDTVRSAASSVKDSVNDAATGVGQTVSDLTDRLSHGLDDLSDAAKTRVVAARRAAHDARLSTAAAMNRGSRAAVGLFDNQPLVVGALAVALGAALGGALPHSKIEDDAMGKSSDDLFAAAQSLYRDERAKAIAMAKTVASDATGEIKDMGADLADLVPKGKTVGDVILDRAADAATRVYDHATGATNEVRSDQSRT